MSQTAHKFDPSILREYDIRGIVGGTVHAADARAIGRTLGTLVRRKGGKRHFTHAPAIGRIKENKVMCARCAADAGNRALPHIAGGAHGGEIGAECGDGVGLGGGEVAGF